MMVMNDTQLASRFLTENRQWQSELGSWELDLMFCSRMLDIYGLKAESPVQKSEQVELKKMVSDVIEVRLAGIRNQLRANEEPLKKAAEDQLLFKDAQLPYRQEDDRKTVDSARASVLMLQQRLYGFIDQLKSI